MIFQRRQSAPRERVADVLERELEVLLRVAKRLTLNDTIAEDIVSQTVLIAFQKWDTFDGGYPRSWLIQILRNEWLQLVRKRNLRQEIVIDAVTEPVEEMFWKEVDSKLENQQIQSAIDNLPDDYRIAITLCDVEQMSYEEASKALEIPLGTFQSRLFRARKILRTRLVAHQP